MNHIKHQIQAYLDGELTTRETRDLEGHVRRCAVCRQALDDRQELWRRVDMAADVPVAISIWPRLVARLESGRDRHWTWPYRSLALAATLAGMLVGWHLGQPAHPDHSNDDTAAEAGYLEERAPSLDQLWLLAGTNGGPGS
jgi:anti-sigma factor RsiW